MLNSDLTKHLHRGGRRGSPDEDRIPPRNFKKACPISAFAGMGQVMCAAYYFLRLQNSVMSHTPVCTGSGNCGGVANEGAEKSNMSVRSLAAASRRVSGGRPKRVS